MNIAFNVYEAEQCSNSCGETVAGGMPRKLPSPETCLRAICLRPPFLSVVDSRPGFRYSVDLARCCARGPCVGVQTDGSSSAGRSSGPGWLMPEGDRLAQAAGCRVGAVLAPIRLEPEPFLRASPRDPHPNRFVWQWVEIGPVRFIARARALCAGFLRVCSGV